MPSIPQNDKLWREIKHEYVTTETSYRALAKRYGVHLRTLAERAKAEKWVEARQKHSETIASSMLRAAQQDEIKRQSQHLIKLQTAADKLVDIASAVMEDEESCKDQYGRYDPRRLRELATSIRELLTITRNVYDLPSIQEQSAMDIAAERLKLEQRKVEQAESDKNEGIEIVMGDGVKELAQ